MDSKPSIKKNLFRSFFLRDYRDTISLLVRDCESLLDVGCGDNSPVKFISNIPHKIGVDIFQPALEESARKKIHNEYVQSDVLSLTDHFKEGAADCSLASELIEHLEKEAGFELLKQMEYVSRKKVIITTPVGFLPQSATEDNPWQLHRSGWTPAEMRELGYKVIGFNGAKFIWNIKFLWEKRDNAALLIKVIRKLLLIATDLFTRRNPKYAFQMICVKEIQTAQ